MNNLELVVENDNNFIVGNISVSNDEEIISIISDFYNDNPYLIFDIRPRDSLFYKGTRKLITAIVGLGIPVDQIRYYVDDNFLTIEELSLRKPTWKT